MFAFVLLVKFMPVYLVIGGFFGDEGKGSVVGFLALKDKVDICARGGVGPNAGHTVIYNGRTYRLRQVPSGFVYEKSRLLIGPGVLVNPEVLLNEIRMYEIDIKRVGVDKNAGIIEEIHIQREKESAHLKGEIGSTLTGCGQANADRALRILKLARDVDTLRQLITSVPDEIWEAIDSNKKVLVEGTQGTFLSLYHGFYPYVTSKDTTAGTLCGDIGIGPKDVDEVVLVFKAFVTRVGAGPLPGELPADEVKRRGWEEYGTVTGRLRRAAPFNYELAKRAIRLNSATQIAITKLDALFPKDRGKRSWDELSPEAKEHILELERNLGVPVTIIRTGLEIHEAIDRRKP